MKLEKIDISDRTVKGFTDKLKPRVGYNYFYLIKQRGFRDSLILKTVRFIPPDNKINWWTVSGYNDNEQLSYKGHRDTDPIDDNILEVYYINAPNVLKSMVIRELKDDK